MGEGVHRYMSAGDDNLVNVDREKVDRMTQGNIVDTAVYKFERLSSSEHHSLVKAFNFSVLRNAWRDVEKVSCANPWLKNAAHNMLYNYGDSPFVLEYCGGDHDKDCRSVLRQTIHPGDSFYIQPNIEHR